MKKQYLFICVVALSLVVICESSKLKRDSRAVDAAGDSENVIDNKATGTDTKTTTLKPTGTTNNVANSTTDNGNFGSNIYRKIKENKGMLMRTFYVLLGVTSIVIIYFGVRAWRTRRRRSKSRKYGLITTPGADLEMEPLDRDVEEDDDMTVFEINGRRK